MDLKRGACYLAAGLAFGYFTAYLPAWLIVVIALSISGAVFYWHGPYLISRRCVVCHSPNTAPITRTPARAAWSLPHRPRVDWLCIEHLEWTKTPKPRTWPYSSRP